jgi:hypothetical protein
VASHSEAPIPIEQRGSRAFKKRFGEVRSPAPLRAREEVSPPSRLGFLHGRFGRVLSGDRRTMLEDPLIAIRLEMQLVMPYWSFYDSNRTGSC